MCRVVKAIMLTNEVKSIDDVSPLSKISMVGCCIRRRLNARRMMGTLISPTILSTEANPATPDSSIQFGGIMRLDVSWALQVHCIPQISLWSSVETKCWFHDF